MPVHADARKLLRKNIKKQKHITARKRTLMKFHLTQHDQTPKHWRKKSSAYARGISCGSRWRRKAERRWAICSWTGSRLACATRTPSSGRPSRPVASTWTRRWSPRRKWPPAASRIPHPPLHRRSNARTPGQGQSRSHFDGTQDMLWSISLRFNDHFSKWTWDGLAGTRMAPFWISLELRTMEVMVTTEAIRCTKLYSNCHH